MFREGNPKGDTRALVPCERYAYFGRGRRFTLLTFAVVAAITLLVSACGAASKPTASAPNAVVASALSRTNVKTTVMKVTTLDLCDEIGVDWALDKGIFRSQGLKVSLVQSSGGAAAISALESGAVDLAFTNPFSTMLAIRQGVNLRWVATAYDAPTKESKATSALVVRTSSGITSAKELTGKTIAVNEVGGINEIIVSQWIKDAGGNPAKSKFVALPFNELASAVADGKVDAALTEVTLAAGIHGIHSLGDPNVAVGAGTPLIYAGYVTTAHRLTSEYSQMAAFEKSLVEADAAVNNPANRQKKLQVMSKYCKEPVADLAKSPENTYVATVNPSNMNRMGRILEDQDLVKRAPTAAEFVARFDFQ